MNRLNRFRILFALYALIGTIVVVAPTLPIR